MNGTFRDPWELAKERFREGLTDEEKAQFNHVEPEEVLYEASAAQKRAQADSKAWYMASKLMPVVDAIGQYGTAFDVISNTSPEILCPLWGGLRIVLTIAQSFGKYHDKLLDMFERIGDVLPRFDSYAKLFPSHRYLLHALSLAYLDILLFCTAAKKVFLEGRNKYSKKINQLLPPSLKVGMKLLWRPFEIQFGQFMENFRRHKANVEREALSAHMIESSEEREAQTEERRLQNAERSLARQDRIEEERRRKEARWKFILLKLCPYDYEKKMKDSQKIRHTGTCGWIKECDNYKSWANSSQSGVLWVYGKAGCGKTILSGWVYENQLEIVRNIDDAIVLSYLCSFKEANSLSATAVLESYIKQILLLLTEAGTPEDILETMELALQGNKSLDFDTAVGIFFALARMFKRIWVILDGIDECIAHSIEDIIQWIARAQQFSDSRISLYVSSRKDIEIKDRLERYPAISLSDSQPASDLNGYIVEQVNLLKTKGELKLGSPGLYQKVVEKLKSKADGMFLWVALQLKDICDCATDSEVEEALDHLPIGLYETYEHGLRRIFVDRKDPRARSTSRRVYNWIYHAKRPLTTSEIMEAISINIDDNHLNQSKIAFGEQIWRIIKRCGNLLEYNEADDTISFFHYTLKQYITELPHNDEISSEAKIVDVAKTICSSEELIARLCLTYLSFSDFETKVVPFQQSTVSENMQLIQKYASNLATTNQTNAIGKGFQSIMRGFRLANGFFDDEARVKIDFSRYVYLPKPPPESVIAQYKLLEYIRRYWLQHCRVLDSADGELFPRGFLKLCFEGAPAVEIRPWGQRYSQGLYPYTDAFVWAIENDHCFLLSAIKKKIGGMDSGYYRGLTFQGQTTSAHIAASHPTADTLRWLSEKWTGSYDPEYLKQVDYYGRNILHIAVLSNSFGVSEYLFETSIDKNWWAHQDIHGNTPFDYAIESRNIKILDLLNDNGCNVIDVESSVSPGWSTNGDPAPKLGKLFCLVCSLDRADLYQKLSPLFLPWIEKSTADNLYLLEGIEMASKSGNAFIAKSALMALPQGHLFGPVFKSSILRSIDLMLCVKDHDAARSLLVRFGQGIEFRHINDDSPQRSSQIGRAVKDLYPVVIPSLLASYLGTPDSEMIKDTLLPDIDFGIVDPQEFQRSLLTFDCSSLGALIRQITSHPPGFSFQLYHYIWENTFFLHALTNQGFLSYNSSVALERFEEIGHMLEYIIQTIPLETLGVASALFEKILITLVHIARNLAIVYYGCMNYWGHQHDYDRKRVKISASSLLASFTRFIGPLMKMLDPKAVASILVMAPHKTEIYKAYKDFHPPFRLVGLTKTTQASNLAMIFRTCSALHLDFYSYDAHPQKNPLKVAVEELVSNIPGRPARLRFKRLGHPDHNALNFIGALDELFGKILKQAEFDKKETYTFLKSLEAIISDMPPFVPCLFEAILEKDFLFNPPERRAIGPDTLNCAIQTASEWILYYPQDREWREECLGYIKLLLAAGADPFCSSQLSHLDSAFRNIEKELEPNYPKPGNSESSKKYILKPTLQGGSSIDKLTAVSKAAILTMLERHHEITEYPRRFISSQDDDSEAILEDDWEYRMITLKLLEADIIRKLQPEH
ncbi:hypothetical protein TWF718_010268 [Orbilia javanica]|uniref:NACHT domain-containing protein n=1 Tax=Orbilia javanica TaxID=47235 RepID=A0AAN8MLP4_9PEZI